MTQPPAAQHYRERQAGALQSGDHLILPGGDSSAELQEVELEKDDFGAPALIIATLPDGVTLRIAVGSSVLVADSPAASLQLVKHPNEEDDDVTAAPAVVVPPLPPTLPATVAGAAETDASPAADEELALIPEQQGTPETVVQRAAEAHPDAEGVLLLSERLIKGINTKSGSCLKDLSDLAHELFILLQDPENALAVADLLNVLPYDGNPGRWSSVEAALALSSYICRQTGQEERAEIYEKLLRAPDSQESDPFKARVNARVRQRSLNEPNLYDKEIFRSIDNSNRDAEREWRFLRLQALLFLRAHGGSETIGGPELNRRINNELEAVRA
ncbi:hypothetical protein M1D88_03335 [Arthrobacter sp. R1-13]